MLLLGFPRIWFFGSFRSCWLWLRRITCGCLCLPNFLWFAKVTVAIDTGTSAIPTHQNHPPYVGQESAIFLMALCHHHDASYPLENQQNNGEAPFLHDSLSMLIFGGDCPLTVAPAIILTNHPGMECVSCCPSSYFQL